jgi:nicotinamide-nucleotide amidase
VDAEIIAIGSELLTPYRQDTNSLYLTEKLNQLGVEVTQKTVVGDSRERIAAATRVLKVVMLGESECDARVAPIYLKHTDVQTTVLAYAGQVELHLRARADSLGAAQDRVDKLAEELEDELDDFVFSRQGETLEQIVGYYLQMRGATAAVAESCTGGLISQRITSVAGSSRYFLGGATVYSNQLKAKFADVPKALIAEHGAVSSQVAAAMAEGIRKRCGATWGLAITGIAGPTGGTQEKPVGLVYHALTNGESSEVVERKFPGDRERVRWWASQQALDMLRRKLM